MEIRRERTGDVGAIRDVHLEAFGQPAEADIVDELRRLGQAEISLVATEDGELLGHILFSPVRLGDSFGLGLAPMAVRVARQRAGVGSQLVRAGLEAAREAGWPFVVVLGHPTYYPRFGFVPASRFGVSSIYDVPDEVFMALELVEDGLSGLQGTVRYASPLE